MKGAHYGNMSPVGTLGAPRYTSPSMLPHDDHAQTAIARIIDFVTKIGFEVRTGMIRDKTFLPGIVIHHGALVIDPSQWTYPGDLLHEAGHLAVMEPRRRNECHIDVGNDAAEEMMAIAWSYAASVDLGLSLSTVFHEGGYRGGSQSLIENFSQGRYIAVPMLQWVGMTAEPKRAAADGVAPYPHMLRWLRDF